MAAMRGYSIVLCAFVCFVRFTCTTTQPSILIAPTDRMVVLRGEHATSYVKLHCFVIGYRDKLTVSWYKDGEYISNNRDIVEDRVDTERYSVHHPDGGGLFTLVIEEVSTATADKDGGWYRCVVKENDDVLIQTPKAQVQVSSVSVHSKLDDLPRCTPNKPTYNYTEGSTVKLRCESEVSLDWVRDGRNATLTATSTGNTGEGLKFVEYSFAVSSEDDGAVFTCGSALQSGMPYKSCKIGPISVTMEGTTDEQGLVTVHIIAIAVGGTLLLSAVLIITAVVVFKVRQRRKYDRILKRTRDFAGWQTSPIDPTHELRYITNPRPVSHPLGASNIEESYPERRTSWKANQPDVVIMDEKVSLTRSRESLAKSDTNRRRSTDVSSDPEPQPQDTDRDYENVQPLMDEINEHFMMLNSNTIEL